MALLPASIPNCVTLRGRLKEAVGTLRKQDPALPEKGVLNRCEACFNWVWTVQLTRHIACTWTVQDIWSIAIGHGIHALSIKTKEKSGLRTPRTALCKSVGGAKQRTFEHTFISTTASHSEQQRFNYAWTTRQATMSTPDLGIHAYMHVSCVKKSYFASFGPKNLQFFILAFVLRFRTTKSVITESWTAWQWVNNAIDPATAASSIWIEKPTKHIYMTSRMATTVFDVICLATGDTKHLHHAYSGCIRFKLLHPRVEQFNIHQHGIC